MMKMKHETSTIQLDLAGFTWPELTILANHLHYATDRLRQEMDALRQAGRKHSFFRPKAAGKTKAQPQGLMISQWASLIRDYRYFAALARAVDAVVDDSWAALFISDRPLPPLDLSGLLNRDNQYLFRFLNRERHRSELAIEYIQRQTFEELVKQDLLLALDVEIRFFVCLLEWLDPIIPASLSRPWPEEDRVPLLFVSLPRVLTTGYALTAPFD